MKTTKKIFWGLLALAVLLFILHRYVRLPLLKVAAEEAIPRHSALVFSATGKALLAAGTARSLPALLLPDNVQTDLSAFGKVFGKQLPVAGDLPVMAAAQPVRTGGFDVLFIVDGARSDLRQAVAALRSRTSIFRNHEVLTVKSDSGDWAVCKYRNLLLFARHAYLVEHAISQLESPATSPCREKSFRLATDGWRQTGTGLEVLVNLQQVNSRFAPLMNAARARTLSKIGETGTWARLQLPGLPTGAWKAMLSHHPDNRLLDANHRAPLLPFKNAFRALPDNLTCFWWLAVSDWKPSELKSQWRRYFKNWLGNEMAYAIGEPLQDAGSEQFLLMKTTDAKETEAALKEFSEKNAKTQQPDYQMFKVYRLTDFDLGEMLGTGEGFAEPWATVLGEYVLLANSRTGLERWLGKYIAGQTYSKDVAFLQSLRNLPVEAKGFVYLESSKAWQQAIHFLDDQFLTTLASNPLPFSYLAAAMTRSGACSEWSVVSPVAPRPQETPANILWKVPLEAEVALAPAVFQNPKTGEAEIFIQDKNHTAYLVSRSGKVLWRRPLTEPIRSRIYQLDLYNDREHEFAFSTASGIHVLDASGEPVAGFPLQLQTPATNGVTVVDFFKSGEYQFFIACKNGSAYGFDENGSPVEGWRPKTGVGKTSFPLVHFQNSGKDYLVLLNDVGDLQVYQKNGEERFPVKKLAAKFLQGPDFQVEKNTGRIVACNRAGQVSVCNLAGEEFNLLVRTGRHDDVRFAFADVAGDARKEYISLSGPSLWCHGYNDKGAFALVFTDTLAAPQDEVFTLPWKNRPKDFIGTLCREKMQISLLDGTGRMLPQFPLAGTTPFALADLLGDGKPVVVVGNGNQLYAYSLE